MNIIKKSLSVFLALTLLFSVIPLSVSAASVFSGGSGDKSDPYQISTTAQLNKIRNYPNDYFILKNDIVFSKADFQEGGTFYNYGYGWEPIKNFTGVLDGNGYMIQNLYVYNPWEGTSYSGLFGTLSGSVSNVTMYNCYILGYGTNYAYSGAIAGINEGTIYQCYSSGEVYALSDARAYAGGICGSNEGNITLCVNYALVDSEYDSTDISYYAGGIAGLSDWESTIMYCVNHGNIYGKLAGGIVGYCKDADIYLCRNNGSINEEIDDFDTLYSGGIAAYASEDSKIAGCINSGSVTATSPSDYAYAGGIIAHSNSSSVYDSYNLGNVSSNATSSSVSSSFAGGIVGYNNSPSSAASYENTIVNVYNRGSVSAKASSSSTSKYAGGIAGKNSGVVSSAYYLNNISKGLGNNVSGTSADGTIKLTDTQMKNPDSYVGFDLKDMWWINSKSGYDYPQLTLLSETPATSITITEQPKNTIFFTGSVPDLSGGKMAVTYSNGYSEVLDTGELSIVSYDNETTGKQTVTAVYANFPIEIEIAFIRKTPNSIRLTSLPSKLNYVQGQPISIDGAVLEAVYDKEITMELDIHEAEFSYDKSATGEVTVTVKHGNLTTEYTINVNERTVSNLEIDSEPQNTVYTLGSELDISGAKLKVFFLSDDNYSEIIDITSEMLTDFDMNTIGKQTVTVSYGDKTASFDIHIIEVEQGDVNGNGAVDTKDLSILKLYLAGFISTEVIEQEGYADFNCDGEITTADLALLKLRLVNS